jgi:TldD protein
MDTDLVDFAVEHARSKGATYAEARFEEQTNEDFIVKGGIVDAVDLTESRGIGVRVLAKGSIGFSATNVLTRAVVREVVDRAVALAKGAKRKQPITFAPEPAVVADWSVPEVRPLADTPVEERVNEIVDIDRALVDLKSRIPGRFFMCYSNRISKYFANSEGSKIHSYSPRVRLYYHLTIMKGGDAEQCNENYGWSGGWEALAEVKAHERVLEAAESAINALEHGRKSPEGRTDLVAGPQVSGIASHESCGHPTEADRILGREASQAGKSFITPETGSMKIGSSVVNVVDDPTMEHAIAYYKTDDEGVKARRRYLYKGGKVTEFLQNRETAAVLGTRSNGAARATNYDREAIVRMANTFVEPRDRTPADMIEEVKRGVYMKSFTEWNIDDKRWNGKYVGREAYLIENGEVKGPVRRTVVELTTKAFWSAVDAVGNDLELFHAGWCGKSDPGQALDAALGGPTIRLRDVYLR